MSNSFNIVDLFFAASKNNPQKTAIIFRDHNVSFGVLENQVENTARYFLNRGIAKGDKVLVFVPMSIDLYRIILALFRIGATAVFLDEWVSKKRMEECCKVAQCKAFVAIFKARAYALFSSELRKIPIKLGIDYSVLQSNIERQDTAKEDTALVTFTTGTTGVPKAALRTHGFLLHQFKALEGIIQPEFDDISMAVLPIVLLINLATGTTSIIAQPWGRKPTSIKPDKIKKQIIKYSVNNIIASPFFVKTVCEYLIKKRVSILGMKKVFTGGAPVFPTEAAIYNQAFPLAKIEVVYGSTEAEPISAILVNELLLQDRKSTTGLNVGKVAHCASVKIIQIIDDSISVDSAGLSEIILPVNEIGEIIVSGNHVLRNYLNNDEALNRNKIFIGDQCWHRTGDSGYFDENKTLFLTGRCSTLIKKGDKMIYPFIYENYFQTIRGVEIGTIILLKEEITAVIELKKKMNTNLVENTIRSHFPILEKIIFLKKIPRDPRHNSKIDYQKLTSSIIGKVIRT